MKTAVRPALTRYRIMAYVVGVGLLLLVLVGMPLKYFFDQPTAVAIIGPIHGFLYAVYLLVTLDLGAKSQWSFVRTVLVMLAGTIPFLSFVMERRVTASVLGAD